MKRSTIWVYFFRLGGGHIQKNSHIGTDFDVVLFECEWPPPIYLYDYLEHIPNILHAFSTNIKNVFLCQKFLPTHRNPPMARTLCLGGKFLDYITKSREILHLTVFRSQNE